MFQQLVCFLIKPYICHLICFCELHKVLVLDLIIEGVFLHFLFFCPLFYDSLLVFIYSILDIQYHSTSQAKKIILFVS